MSKCHIFGNCMPWLIIIKWKQILKMLCVNSAFASVLSGNCWRTMCGLSRTTLFAAAILFLIVLVYIKRYSVILKVVRLNYHAYPSKWHSLLISSMRDSDLPQYLLVCMCTYVHIANKWFTPFADLPLETHIVCECKLASRLYNLSSFSDSKQRNDWLLVETCTQATNYWAL